MRYLLIGLEVIVSIVLIISVLMQPSKTQGLSGFVPGASESFFSKNKARTYEALMAKVTIISAICFAAIALALNLPAFR